MTTDIIMKNDNMMNTYKTSEIKKITKSVVSMSGKENGHMDIETNAKEHSMKRGVKRTLTECDLCAAKKQKTMVVVYCTFIRNLQGGIKSLGNLIPNIFCSKDIHCSCDTLQFACQ